MSLVSALRKGPKYVIGKLIHTRPKAWSEIRKRIAGNGIEIGGPSPVFSSAIPVYPLITSADNYTYEPRPGFSLGREFQTPDALLPREDESCDFVISSHVLEHIANPILALKEWFRVLRPGGSLLPVLPEGSRTWDRNRPVTTMQHLVEDFRNNVGEDDLTHLEEVITLTDRSHWTFPADSPHDWDAIYRDTRRQ